MAAAAAAAAITAARDLRADREPPAAAAAPAPRAGAVSQQNASPCGGAGPARGGEEGARVGPLGRCRLSSSRRRHSSPRPFCSAGPARRPGESGGGGGGGVAERAPRRTARRQRFSPGPLSPTP